MNKKLVKALNCKGKLLQFNRPLVMGILNVSPDSFYDGGKYDSEHRILSQVEKMVQEGANILDIGGMSSRPGAALVDSDEELRRVIPAIEVIVKQFPDTIISVDTIKTIVAKESIEAGAHLINDISAGVLDEDLLKTVAKMGVPYILMHMQGLPKNMQEQPKYEDILVELFDFFTEKISLLKQHGIYDIILDPGFGFGKTLEHNYILLNNLSAFQLFDLPILTGISRKSMIYKVLGTRADKALNGTTAMHMLALQNGASILRVHDVQEAVETITLWEYAKTCS